MLQLVSQSISVSVNVIVSVYQYKSVSLPISQSTQSPFLPPLRNKTKLLTDLLRSLNECR